MPKEFTLNTPRAEDVDSDGCSAWNPGISAEIPPEFRPLETIFRPDCVCSRLDDVREFASLTGLAHEELTLFRPQRLALHELIIRITADIAIAEGDEEEVFGQNFRAIATRIRDVDLAPQMPAIEQTWAGLRQRADVLIREILGASLFAPPAAPAPRRFPFGLLRRPQAPATPAEAPAEREQRVVTACRTEGLAATDPLRRAVLKSLYRVLGAILATRGQLGADIDLLATLACNDVCNTYGSQLVGEAIAPLVDAAIAREGYVRVRIRDKPVLISLKGASAAGKSSVRPMIKKIMREQGIEPDGYATISPDVWRKLLLDYASLGPATKYAGSLTGRELRVIDAKLDRHIRAKANRDRGIPHLLVDRFRFDSFASEPVARILHDTYARYVDTLIMYFIVTPPEETVERGWRRGLERGRYKAVEDFLGHSVEAYAGMPKLLFKWLAYARPEFRYVFLDNRVPKGSFPLTIASGNQHEMRLFDPACFINIERYQKIDISATSRATVHPTGPTLDAAHNIGFLAECIRRIAVVSFVQAASGTTYLQASGGRFTVLDAATLARVLANAENRAIIGAIAPQVVVDAAGDP